MTLLCELDVAKRLNHPFFNGHDISNTAKKKRVRQLARRSNVKPVIIKHDIWLFHEEDIELLTRCRSSFEKERDRHIGKSRAPIAGSAFEKARRLTTVK